MRILIALIFCLLYQYARAQETTCPDCGKAIFILDNSGSVSMDEYNGMLETIEQISKILLHQELPYEIAIVQYGTTNFDSKVFHLYDVSVPFTTDIKKVLDFERVYIHQDHLPGSLSEMRKDGVWEKGSLLDIESTNCEVKCFIFTDAAREEGTCCSSLSNTGNAPDALSGFEEYNFLKANLGMDITVYHVAQDPGQIGAGSAIASLGGNFYGDIDFNEGDPEGDGELPRKYFTGLEFSLSEEHIKSIALELKLEECDSSSSIEVPNVFTPNFDGHNDILFLSSRNIQSLQVTIFNRWGQVVVDWTQTGFQWDGNNKSGEPVPDGVYFYTLVAKGLDKKVFNRSGNITVLR